MIFNIWRTSPPPYSMYILLRGQVTIFILYAAKGDADEEKPNQLQLNSAKVGSEALRQQLGTFVTNLGRFPRGIFIWVSSLVISLVQAMYY